MHSLTSALTLLLVIVAVAGTLAALIVIKKRSETGVNKQWPFYVKRPLTSPEQILLHRLVDALPGHIILAQVQVSRVLGVKKGHNFANWNNRISQLSYDYVICDKSAGVIAVVELDDNSHNAPRRAAADAKKEKATLDAGVKLIRWRVSALPDDATIHTALKQPTTA